ncbi:N-acetylmuramoyl-L-alanine amidase [Clostridium cochlearium]|uniref:N-acetylmuramoyl-L-alanine amidase n=1 Tax=Clostridium cochlearium TaxID=1494 RepID=UPI0018789FF0|nr:N-acetylmuramoyl-L-alanine amidase [Clostridium cochlearium]MBV1816836.1 N-acetylmuramoyl-L-alanine amidase [Bacteroidales bacterium MSK.15.36]MCG4571799.1 N-acetylmuramoyl-L-alanine amidase [Clostridium cochlearium]MCG4579128.1 N-acetylmuramoyl-L-alanine amidase [Clostridium cochlearium]NSJ90115.1 hypothetical protein [Coprococcus sp. MSK.21.13]
MKINESNLKFRSLSYGNIPKSIVLHHAEAKQCSIYDIHNWHLGNGWSGCGYHFLVRKDGSIWRGRPENAMGSHTKKHNIKSIGICAEGSYTTETMPEVQKKAIIELGIYIKNKYNINQVYGHKDLNSTTCPGPKYPLTEIKQAILKGKIPTINNSFLKLDGGGTISDNKPAINLIIKDFSKDIERIFAYVDSDEQASWAFDLTPPNKNYIKLEKNCSKVINKRNNGNVFTSGATYKITAKGYSKGVEVCKSNIVLTVPKVDNKLYRVQVGAFKNKEYAEDLRDELKEKGYNDTYIKEE